VPSLLRTTSEFFPYSLAPTPPAYRVIYGGAPRGGQLYALRNNQPPIVVATPGRLQDFVQDGAISLANVSLPLFEAESGCLFATGGPPL